MAVYHVSPGPVGAAAGAVPTLPPLAAAKFMSSSERSDLFAVLGRAPVPLPRGTVAWAGGGPRRPPFLVLSLSCERRTHCRDGEGPADMEREDTSRSCLLAFDVPWRGGGDVAPGGEGGRPRPIGVVCESPADGARGPGGAVLIAGSSQSIVRYDGRGGLSALLPTTLPPTAAAGAGRAEDDLFASLSRPVSSASLGLDSDGAVHFGDSRSSPAAGNDYHDSVLSVFTTSTCGPGEGGAPPVPSQRHWLMISSPGDTRADVKPSRDPSDGGAVEVTSATTDVLFELTCGESPSAGLVPGRVVREDAGRRVAVLFAPGFLGGGGDGPDRARTRADVRRDPVAYAILDLVSWTFILPRLFGFVC